jgi:hypothetical protein
MLFFPPVPFVAFPQAKHIMLHFQVQQAASISKLLLLG